MKGQYLSDLGQGHPAVRPAVEWGATVELRYRAVSFGRPVLQQKWIALRGAKGLSEWRDVPVEAVE